MVLQLAIPIIIVISLFTIFNPYMAFTPRSACERWQTRERSYGHPFYWKMKNLPEFHNRHLLQVYNKPLKMRRYPRTTMYVE